MSGTDLISNEHSFGDHENDLRKKCDSAAMQILANWIAAHNGYDDHAGAVVDRGFVIVEVPN